MQGAEQLLSIAEIGATFAGFTAIVGALGQSRGSETRVRLVFWLMIEFSITTIFFSLIPFAVWNFGAPETAVWALASILLAIFVVVHVSVVSVVFRKLRDQIGPLGRARYGPMIVVPLFLLVFLVNVLNSVGFFFERTYAAYFLGLLLFLSIATTNFVFLLAQFWKSDGSST